MILSSFLCLFHCWNANPFQLCYYWPWVLPCSLWISLRCPRPVGRRWWRRLPSRRRSRWSARTGIAVDEKGTLNSEQENVINLYVCLSMWMFHSREIEWNHECLTSTYFDAPVMSVSPVVNSRNFWSNAEAQRPTLRTIQNYAYSWQSSKLSPALNRNGNNLSQIAQFYIDLFS